MVRHPTHLAAILAAFVQIDLATVLPAGIATGSTCALASWALGGRLPRLAGVVVGAAIPAAALGAAALGFVAAGGPAQRWPPGPFDGDRDATIVLRADRPADADLGVLTERLAALEVSGTVTRTAPTEVQVVLRGVADPAAVAAALVRKEAFEIRAVDRTHAPWTCGTPPPGPPPVSGAQLDELIGGRCRTWSLFAPGVDHDDIEDARVVGRRSGSAAIEVAMTPAGRARLAELTTRSVGRQIALVSSGRVLVVPMVREPLLGGRVLIEVTWSDRAHEAPALAAALATRRLSAAWAPVP